MSKEIKKALKQQQLISLDGKKFLVVTLRADHAEIIPVCHALQNSNSSAILPYMKVQYELLKNFQPVSDFELFCLIDQKHPKIKKAVEEFINERKKSRKD